MPCAGRRRRARPPPAGCRRCLPQSAAHSSRPPGHPAHRLVARTHAARAPAARQRAPRRSGRLATGSVAAALRCFSSLQPGPARRQAPQTTLPDAPRTHVRPMQGLPARRRPTRGSWAATRTTARQSRAASHDPARGAAQRLPPACVPARCRATAQQRCCTHAARPQMRAPAHPPHAVHARSVRLGYPRPARPPQAGPLQAQPRLGSRQMPARRRCPTRRSSHCAPHRRQHTKLVARLRILLRKWTR